MASGLDRSKIYFSKGEWYWDPTGIDGTGGDGLGYTVSGFEIEWGEEIIEDETDETGAQVEQMFFAGQNVRLRTVFKQWNPELLAALFPNQYDSTDKRIEIPGDRVPGDAMDDESGILVFVPDNPYNKAGDSGKDMSVIAFKAVPKKVMEPTMISNTQQRRIAVEFLCLEDRTITTGDRAKYRTIGIGPNDELAVS